MDSIKAQLSQGISPHALALACAVGVTVGLFPILGVTTYLCFIIGYFLRLNQPILQAVQYLVYPLQLILLPVFFSLSAAFFHTPKVSFNLTLLKEEFLTNKAEFFSKYISVGLYSSLIWLILAPFLAGLIYGVSLIFFKKSLKNKKLPGSL